MSETREWMLKRNCSLSPRQLLHAYLMLFLISSVMAGFCLWRGAWLVAAYALIELTVVGAAFICYARHATDHEHMALLADCLLIETELAGQIYQIRLDPRWTRVALPQTHDDLIKLEERGVCLSIGRFVTSAVRRRVACELRQQLRLSGIP